MTVVIEADPDDQYLTINLDGEPEEVLNEHQGIRFAVYDSDGLLIGSGTSREELDTALGQLRVIDERRGLIKGAEKKAIAERLANLTERIVAHGEVPRTAVLIVANEPIIADLPEDGSYPEPKDLEWRSDDDPEPGMMI
ncbi:MULTISPECIES: hypothetical protein [unclassified Rhizobium]|uniref:hypothetical protein n=1 Tax=unclassified Rhizobium TaxID=2613769 RepID=UPI001784915E|nr:MULTISPECIES: hypothetical protein [unclassified Rhizobium]MBD8687234.1 hypothetical protein [Rhizobium sp. CFBP 13644]MBD8690963.1 hypothetical protein [Rhizobium sp. CFBP 13717]